MLTDESSSAYKQLRRIAEILAAPIEFDRLVVEGVLQQKGSWYEILDWDELPESARVKIKAVRPPNLVQFRKPSKRLRKFLRRGY